MTDPYATPTPPKDKSGALMRYAILAALLGLGVWGYMEFSNGPKLVAQEPELTTMADGGYDSPYTVTPTPETVAPSQAAPAATPTTPDAPPPA